MGQNQVAANVSLPVPTHGGKLRWAVDFDGVGYFWRGGDIFYMTIEELSSRARGAEPKSISQEIDSGGSDWKSTCAHR